MPSPPDRLIYLQIFVRLRTYGCRSMRQDGLTNPKEVFHDCYHNRCNRDAYRRPVRETKVDLVALGEQMAELKATLEATQP